MGEQQQMTTLTWVFENFSSLSDKRRFSHTFSVAGYNWHIFATLRGDEKDGHLSLFLGLTNPKSLPRGWQRDVKLKFTLVTKALGKSNLVIGGKCNFDATNRTAWGYREFVSLANLRANDKGFIVNNKITILAELYVFPPEETVKVIEPPSSREGNKVQDDEDASKETTLDDEDTSKDGSDDAKETSKEGSDDDKETSEEGSDDDKEASEEGSDDDKEASDEEGSDDDKDPSKEGSDDDKESSDEKGSDDDDDKEDSEEEGSDDDAKEASDDGSWEEVVDNVDASSSSVSGFSLLNQSNASEEDAVDTIAETEVSNGDHDDSPKEEEDDDSSLVSKDGSINQVKSVEDSGYRKSRYGWDNMEYMSQYYKWLNEIQPAKQTSVINGFEVYSDKVESVSYIFERHPDIAIGCTLKNQQIRRGYMDALLNLIETMCKSQENLTEDDLSNAEDTLADLINAGFKLDWLKTKLREVSEKKKKEQGSEARLQTMERELQKLKLMFLDLEIQIRKEKTEASASKAPLSFNDIVF